MENIIGVISHVLKKVKHTLKVLECEPWVNENRIIGLKLLALHSWNRETNFSNGTHDLEKVKAALHQPNQYMDPDYAQLIY